MSSSAVSRKDMDQRRNRFVRLAAVYCLGGFLLCIRAGAQSEPEPRPLRVKSVRIVGRIAVPAGQSVPTHIRWASDDSVFVSWFHDGVAEVGLDGVSRRAVMPKARTLDPPYNPEHYDHLAVSPNAIVVAQLWDRLFSRPRTWVLKVLTPAGVDTYLVPVVGRGRADRLEGAEPPRLLSLGGQRPHLPKRKVPRAGAESLRDLGLQLRRSLQSLVF
jgi:hypothetical protein